MNDDIPLTVHRPLSTLSVSSIGQTDHSENEVGRLRLSWWDIKHAILQTDGTSGPTIWRRIFHPKKAKQEYSAKMRKAQILDGVVGEVRPGQMIALMGSSGAGKTTLLNILAGRIVSGEPSGTVKVNGKRRDPKMWSKITSYVEQFDLLDGNLTVREMILFAAKIKLPDSLYTSAEKEAKADKLMSALGLSHIANVRIDDGKGHRISGGQMKRVAIAIEMISEKKLIFLDEPTTGLDASTSMALIQNIRELATEYDLSVIMSIHQPRNSILKLFDRILLLSQGKTIFFGTIDEILEHFEMNGFTYRDDENPADFIIDVISLSSGTPEDRYQSQKLITTLQKQWEDIEKDQLMKPNSPALKSRRPRRKSSLFSRSQIYLKKGYQYEWSVNKFKEFGLLYSRYSKIEFRDVKGNIEMLLQFIIFALILGFIFFQLTTENFGGFQSRVGLVYFIVGYFFLLSTEIATIWQGYSTILARERANNTYRLSSAYFAKFLSQLPIRIFAVLCFGTIVYYLAGLRTNTFTAYLLYLAILLSTYICTISFGIAVSTTSFSPLPIFIIFAGYFVNTKTITPILSWIRFVSPMFYALQGFIQNESNGLIIAGQPADVYVADYALNQVSVPWCIGALLFFAVGFFAIGLFGVNKATKNRYIVI